MGAKFTKKKGTTNLGLKYERLNIIRLTLNLTTDDEIKDFRLSSNDQTYGRFDDIVCEIEKKSETEENRLKYAIQIKYSNDKEKLITIQNLQSPEKEKFSILNYFNDFDQLLSKYEGFKIILFTNTKLEKTEEVIRIGRDERRVDVRLEQIKPDELVDTSEDKNGCYRFNIIEECVPIDEELKEKYKKFFDNFFLYTNQKDVAELKEDITSKVLEDFYTVTNTGKKRRKMIAPSINLYKTFIKMWNDFEEEKFKLCKKIMRHILALSLLDRHMIHFEFSDDPLTEKETVLKDALSEFKVTVFRWQQEDKIKKMWRDAKSTSRKNKETENYLEVYRFLFSTKSTISDLSDLDDEGFTRLLWLLNECPSIIKNSKIIKIKEIFRLLPPEKKFVVLVNASEEISEDGITVFSNLSELKNSEIYDKIIGNFKCSIQRKDKFALEELIGRCGHLKEIITPNELIMMANDSFVICDETEPQLSEEYVPRRLSKIIIRTDSVKNKDLHQFRVTNDGQSEWVRSMRKPNGDGRVNELRKFLNEKHTIEESDLLNYEEDNAVNIVCADAGMGKTQLMMKLKIDKRSSLSWTIMIYVRNHYQHLNDNKEGKVDEFKNYIFERNKRRYKKEEINLKFLTYLKDNKFIDVRYIWDGLDEISDEQLKTVTTIIQKLSEQGYKHWITARKFLKEKLEDCFNVLSRTLLEFTEKEQKDYIYKRLVRHDKSNHYDNIITDIFSWQPCQEVLKIPLLIFLLTDLYVKSTSTQRQDWLNNGKFSVSKLYKHFIEKKFRLHSKKQKLDKDNTHQHEKYKLNKAKKIEHYENIAMALHFHSIPKGLEDETKKFLETIKNHGDYVGIIVRVTNENIPVFLHTSFSEYFVASYLWKNNKTFQFENIDVFLNSMKSGSE